MLMKAYSFQVKINLEEHKVVELKEVVLTVEEHVNL